MIDYQTGSAACTDCRILLHGAHADIRQVSESIWLSVSLRSRTIRGGIFRCKYADLGHISAGLQ